MNIAYVKTTATSISINSEGIKPVFPTFGDEFSKARLILQAFHEE